MNRTITTDSGGPEVHIEYKGYRDQDAELYIGGYFVAGVNLISISDQAFLEIFGVNRPPIPKDIDPRMVPVDNNLDEDYT